MNQTSLVNFESFPSSSPISSTAIQPPTGGCLARIKALFSRAIEWLKEHVFCCWVRKPAPIRTIRPDLPTICSQYQQSYPFNRSIADQWVSCFKDPEERRVCQKAVDHLQHITFTMLEKGLEECLNQLNPLISGKRYAVGLAYEKSNEWIYNLVKDRLVTLPHREFPLTNMGSSIGMVYIQAGQNTDLSQVKEKIIVLFDDCSYSGNQLWGFLNQINDHFREKVRVYVVIPFMTEKVYTSLTKEKWITCITTLTRIKSLKETFTENELNLLKADNKSASLWDPNYSLLAECRLNIFPRTQSFCYTDWRYPDGTSFPNPFGRGRLTKEFTKEEYEQERGVGAYKADFQKELKAGWEQIIYRHPDGNEEIRYRRGVDYHFISPIPRPYGYRRIGELPTT
ncbi:MAG: hypothetical protein KGJ02_06400 [Verrucomicrobiota bacterium]|nr:hypothetical protein [Verrucomicrobiota bacterium]